MCQTINPFNQLPLFCLSQELLPFMCFFTRTLTSQSFVYGSASCSGTQEVTDMKFYKSLLQLDTCIEPVIRPCSRCVCHIVLYSFPVS